MQPHVAKSCQEVAYWPAHSSQSLPCVGFTPVIDINTPAITAMRYVEPLPDPAENDPVALSILS